MRVLLRGAQYNGKARFDTWLFTIARNLVIDLSRKRTMASLDEMSEGSEDERPFEIAMSGPSPLEQFQSREDCAEVAEVLLKLEPTYREVLVLRFHEELSLEEIATVTQAPLSTVKSRLYRGLAALKPEMEQLRASRSLAEARGMKEGFDQIRSAGFRLGCASSVAGDAECAGACVGGEPHPPGGAGAGEDARSAA